MKGLTVETFAVWSRMFTSSKSDLTTLMLMLKRAALLLFCSGIISSGFAQILKNRVKSEKTISVFAIAGEPVTAEEFTYLYKKNHTNQEVDFTPEKINEYLTLFINFKLKVKEAKMRGMDTTASFIKEYNSYRNELRKPYLPDARLTDSLVRLTYERMKEEIKASHILVSVKPDVSPGDTLKAYKRIMEIRSKIAGGEDFASAAALYSDDPSAKTNQGNLGYFTAMQMVYSFETAAYSMKVGDVSNPVRTRFGYHIIKVYDRRPARGEVEVSHIMIRTGEGKDNQKAKDNIFTVYEQLQAGMKWEDLCNQYSEDPASKDNGGKLRPFGTGAMASVPGFESVAFGLQKPGEWSDPFQTQYGWHIIRLERMIPLPSFEVLSPSLKNRVLRDERTELSKQAMQVKLRTENLFQENNPVKSVVMGLADSSLLKGNWVAPAFPNAEKVMLFKLKDQQYTVKDFLTYAQKNQRQNTYPPVKYLDQLYNNFVEESILELVEKKIIGENPTYRYLLKEYYEGILLFEIMEKEVWNKASEDSIGQRAYYESHKSDYLAAERVNAVLYSSSTHEFSAPLREIVLLGDESKIQDFVRQKKIKTESGYYLKGDKPIFDKMPWSSGVYSVENNGMYYLAWLKDILPPGEKSFEEARTAIISDYQGNLEKMWLEQLKRKYPVKVNGKGKQYVLQQLQAK